MHESMQNVFLVGPMGSGKTTIGRQVARELGLEFHDCDQELEEATGASVTLIFDIEGESGFRKRESRLLRQLAKRRGVLVATGGGVVTREENRKVLRRSGVVVWLQASVDQQLSRLSHDKTRPLLQTQDRKAMLLRLASERDPLYAMVADLVYASGNQSAKAAAGALGRLIREHVQGISSGDHRAHS
jgi:shikimate kinase